MRFQLLFIISLLSFVSCMKDKVEVFEPQTNYAVEYTDWSNTAVSDSLLLDLNGDSIPDFKLELYNYIGGQNETGVFYNQLASIIAVNDDFAFSFGTEHDQNDYDCLKLNEFINENITWYENGVSHNFHTNIFTGQYIHVGIWDLFEHDNHIGYRQKSGDAYHYGWIKLSTSWSEIIVIESAVNTTPNQEIPTGYKN